jgi:REP element-mobilizing transposase RayT
MPRKARYEAPGAVHHVYARGVDRCAIFRDDQDRWAYLDLLAEVVQRWKWDCLAYCLMGNHVHLLVRTPDPTLGRGIHRLHSFYAQDFNARHGRIGHLFQDRYGSSRVWTPGRLLRVADYIADNPVMAGFCRHAADWPWGSAAVMAAGDAPLWIAGPSRLVAVQRELNDDSYTAQLSAATLAQERDRDVAPWPARDIAALRSAA